MNRLDRGDGSISDVRAARWPGTIETVRRAGFIHSVIRVTGDMRLLSYICRDRFRCFCAANASEFDRARISTITPTTRRRSQYLKQRSRIAKVACSFSGSAYFMDGEYRKADGCAGTGRRSCPERFRRSRPGSGRAYGRRAETSFPLQAIGLRKQSRGRLSKKRCSSTRIIAEALNDLFDFYMEAPGFMGGGH